MKAVIINLVSILTVFIPSHMSFAASVVCEGTTTANISRDLVKTYGKIEELNKDGIGSFKMASEQGEVNGIYNSIGRFTANYSFYKFSGKISFNNNHVEIVGSDSSGNIQFKTVLDCRE